MVLSADLQRSGEQVVAMESMCFGYVSKPDTFNNMAIA